MTPGQRWHSAVGERDGNRCRSVEHHPRCSGRFETAHHIVYRSHLIEPALWLVENGIALSTHCHLLAHQRHNLSLPRDRIDAAVDAVNAVPDQPRRGYFHPKLGDQVA